MAKCLPSSSSKSNDAVSLHVESLLRLGGSADGESVNENPEKGVEKDESGDSGDDGPATESRKSWNELESGFRSKSSSLMCPNESSSPRLGEYHSRPE